MLSEDDISRKEHMGLWTELEKTTGQKSMNRCRGRRKASYLGKQRENSQSKR
jgi:hypothetical protein